MTQEKISGVLETVTKAEVKVSTGSSEPEFDRPGSVFVLARNSLGLK